MYSRSPLLRLATVLAASCGVLTSRCKRSEPENVLPQRIETGASQSDSPAAITSCLIGDWHEVVLVNGTQVDSPIPTHTVQADREGAGLSLQSAPGGSRVGAISVSSEGIRLALAAQPPANWLSCHVNAACELLECGDAKPLLVDGMPNEARRSFAAIRVCRRTDDGGSFQWCKAAGAPAR